MVQVPHPRPAEVWVGCDPEESHVAEFPPELSHLREVVGLVYGLSMGSKLFLTEVEYCLS